MKTSQEPPSPHFPANMQASRLALVARCGALGGRVAVRQCRPRAAAYGEPNIGITS